MPSHITRQRGGLDELEIPMSSGKRIMDYSGKKAQQTIGQWNSEIEMSFWISFEMEHQKGWELKSGVGEGEWVIMEQDRVGVEAEGGHLMEC